MSEADDLLSAWFADGPDAFRPVWFAEDAGFDAMLRDRFGALLGSAMDGERATWAATPRGALALCILLDQLPRNIHRGDARAFAADPLALCVARRAVLEDRHDLALGPMERIFLYLPFEHSEDMSAQDLSVVLFEGLRDEPQHAAPGGAIAFAWAHRGVIRRFGRFPHRNAVLGRRDAPGEAAFRSVMGRGF